MVPMKPKTFTESWKIQKTNMMIVRRRIGENRHSVGGLQEVGEEREGSCSGILKIAGNGRNFTTCQLKEVVAVTVTNSSFYRTTLTWTITLDKLLVLLGSNRLLCYWKKWEAQGKGKEMRVQEQGSGAFRPPFTPPQSPNSPQTPAISPSPSPRKKKRKKKIAN